MTDFWKQINDRFPVRKKPEQKAAFREWALAQMEAMGYRAKTEVNGRSKHQNIVAGDPEHAAFLFTAHYDTPARMLLPNLMIPRNFPLFFAYTLLNVGLLLVPALAAMFLVQGLTGAFNAAYITFVAVYFGLLLLLMRGPANPHNANDNTSGVAAVLTLMEAIPEGLRGKVAFILFDDEEKGKQGSKSYAKEHVQVMYTRLTVNMDCIGVGDHLICGATQLARKCTGFGQLERALGEMQGMTAHVFDSRACIINSDQQSFKCGVGLTACKRRKGVGFYTGAIHTPADTVCDARNVQTVAGMLARFVTGALGQKETEAE